MAPQRNKCFDCLKANGLGILICVLRIVALVPLGIYGGLAGNHWDVIKKHTELQGGLYRSLIAKGEHAANRWGAFGFYWSFAAWIPTCAIPPPFSIFLGAIDATVAVLVAQVTHWQTTYSPHNINDCKGSGSHYWQLPPGTNESFFDASARLNATHTSSYAMCKTFVQEWQYGISISFFFSLIATINIVLNFYVCFHTVRSNRRENKSNAKWLANSALAVPKFFFTIALGLAYIPVVFFRCLPRGVKSRTRYTRRYADKTRQRVTTSTNVKMKELKMKSKDVMRYQSQVPARSSPLADFLGIYDTLMLVAQNLHYTDIINLSLTSKSVRNAILPAVDYDRRLNHFRMYTCSSQAWKDCWVCKNQTCCDCEVSRNLKRLPIYHHIDLCKPRCSSCYWALQRRPRTRYSLKCSCALACLDPSYFQRYWHGSSYYANRKYVNVARFVCGTCNELSDADLLARREARTRWELKDPDRFRKCGKQGCENSLDHGPRWWFCTVCKKECSKGCHVAWSGKSKLEENVA